MKLIMNRKAFNMNNKSEWYNLRPILGYFNWAMFAVILAARETGKSYSVTNFFVHQWKTKGIPFTWLRLTEKAAGKLLQNNAEKLIDPDLRRKYDLDLITSGNNVYEVKRKQQKVKQEETPWKQEYLLFWKTLEQKQILLYNMY